MTMPNKRKAGKDDMMQQLPAKKVATDGPMGILPPISLPANMQGTVDGFPAASGQSNLGPSSSGQVTNDSISGSSGKREDDGRAAKMSTGLSQAWEEDVDAGHLLASLFELFGENMFSFTPRPEMSFFL
uniref:Uncharacterized protein n=1 Tax=Nelumbo nucifera TaxID=4432 RepID=A0A822XG61_NELNU|nr:TPA_asm: hypothetical protein HUJ06_019278 [Nelumbo nucifera]